MEKLLAEAPQLYHSIFCSSYPLSGQLLEAFDQNVQEKGQNDMTFHHSQSSARELVNVVLVLDLLEKVLYCPALAVHTQDLIGFQFHFRKIGQIAVNDDNWLGHHLTIVTFDPLTLFILDDTMTQFFPHHQTETRLFLAKGNSSFGTTSVDTYAPPLITLDVRNGILDTLVSFSRSDDVLTLLFYQFVELFYPPVALVEKHETQFLDAQGSTRLLYQAIQYTGIFVLLLVQVKGDRLSCSHRENDVQFIAIARCS